MTSETCLSREPVTLFTTRDLPRVYDRAAMLLDRAAGRLLRQRVDRNIAKVLPAGSVLRADFRGDDGMAQVTDCAYHPYFRKDLFAIASTLEPLPTGSDPTWSRPSVPPDARVLERMLALVGVPYLFGGSAPEGSDSQERAVLERGLLELTDMQDGEMRRVARSSGIDCSGLFNVATEYSFFGDTKDVYARFQRGLLRLEGRPSAADLADALEPLDIVIFEGHMLLGLGDGRVIQAVGDGKNAESFSKATGHVGPPFHKYNRVVVDAAEPIFEALLEIQGRAYSPDWRLDDAHFMVVSYRIAERGP